MTDGIQVEGAVPPPPPPVVPESETMEPVPYARQLWDLVTLFDGLSRNELRVKARLPSGEPIREYARWHNTKTRPNTRVADDEYFDRALQHGIDRGWLVLHRGRITAGVIPPEHTPMQSIGDEVAVRKLFAKEEEQKAWAELQRRNGARHMIFVSKPALRKSLKDQGQLYPILRWHPFASEPLIVDGLTRLELLRDIGVPEEKIWYEDLPRSLTAMEVLQRRIDLELNSTSKDVSKEARDAYIAELAERGFNQPRIAKLVGMAQQRVSEVLSALPGNRYRGQPTEEDVDEFVRLDAGGWALRAIAERTGWSKSTVSSYLDGQKPQPTTATPKRVRPSKTRTEAVKKTVAKRKLADSTVQRTGPKKVIGTLESRPEIRQALYADTDVGEVVFREMLDLPHYADLGRAILCPDIETDEDG